MFNKTANMNLIEKKKFKNAIVSVVKENPRVAVVAATSSYIPIEQFKEVFNFIGDLVIQEKITKLIFDKRKLSVFHQPSMEWYFVEWKEQMFKHGLSVHRKILPNDEVFKQSVKIGREKINKMFPQGKFHQMDIGYSDTVESAVIK
jgi:hypothetical protein